MSRILVEAAWIFLLPIVGVVFSQTNVLLNWIRKHSA